MSRDVRREARVLLAHPWGWIACGCGSGLSPWASGTTGSAAAVALFWIVGAAGWPLWLNLLLCVGVFALGVAASSWACEVLATEDAAPIVIDEWVGQWLTYSIGLLTWPMSAHPWSFAAFLLSGFLLFRLADIVKPWPASMLDRELGGGLGAMADDAAAAVYSALALLLVGLALGASFG
jgi:phosphatidylglycerophosphatase A